MRAEMPLGSRSNRGEFGSWRALRAGATQETERRYVGPKITTRLCRGKLPFVGALVVEEQATEEKK